MGQFKNKKFIATGAIINVNLGFIPAYAVVMNDDAADTEIWKLEYLNSFGDSKELWHYKINNDGGDDVNTPVKKTSGGHISEYNTSSGGGKQKVVTFDDTGGAAEDLLTCGTVSQVPANGDVVKFVESGGLPTNLDELTSYYVIDSEVYGPGTFRISATSPQKGAQSAVDLGSDGTPTNYFVNESKAEPAVTGGKGITIAAAFASDGDVLHVLAWEGDTDTNDGDAANW